MENSTLALSHPQIMSRVLNKPLLLDDSYSRIFVNALAKSSDLSVSFVDPKGANLGVGGGSERKQKSYYAVEGVAVLPVSGTLVHKYGYVQPTSGMTGYDGVQQRLAEADADELIHTIMLDIDSPGGEVSGCRALAEFIAGLETPVVAYVDEMAASAAYWVASACALIAAPPSANIGSIGVVWMHADYSGKLEKDGIKVTFIHAGKHKVDGNPYQSLSAEQAAAFQNEINALYDMFVEGVAAGRTAMSENDIRATEARVYLAQEAMSLGLIDAVVSKNEFIASLATSENLASIRQVKSSSKTASTFTLQGQGDNFKQQILKGSDMDNSLEEDVSFTQADIDAAAAAAAENARNAAVAEYQEKMAAAAARTAAIHGHPKASAGVKELLASDAFASVPIESIAALMDIQPQSFSSIMDNEGGAGLEASPTGMVTDAERSHAESARAAADALANTSTPII